MSRLLESPRIMPNEAPPGYEAGGIFTDPNRSIDLRKFLLERLGESDVLAIEEAIRGNGYKGAHERNGLSYSWTKNRAQLKQKEIGSSGLVSTALMLVHAGIIDDAIVVNEQTPQSLKQVYEADCERTRSIATDFQILDALVANEGFASKNEEIGAALGLATQTVKNRFNVILPALGVENREQVAVIYDAFCRGRFALYPRWGDVDESDDPDFRDEYRNVSGDRVILLRTSRAGTTVRDQEGAVHISAARRIYMSQQQIASYGFLAEEKLPHEIAEHREVSVADVLREIRDVMMQLGVASEKDALSELIKLGFLKRPSGKKQ